jgi:hypothetical protein
MEALHHLKQRYFLLPSLFPDFLFPRARQSPRRLPGNHFGRFRLLCIELLDRHEQMLTLVCQLALHGLNEILNQVKTVRYLFGGRRKAPSSFGQESLPIPANDGHFGMLLQPALKRIGRALRQQVSYLPLSKSTKIVP